jgi:polyphosphate kinase
MKKNSILNNRELSWLSFNDRVLQEAEDKTVPLIERIKFLGIFSNNRDEFFRVRVAALKRIVKYPKKAEGLFGENPEQLLNKIQRVVIEQQIKFDTIYQNILKELARNNIFIINEKHISAQQSIFIKKFFRENIMPSLFPIMIDNTSKFPYLKDRSGYLIVKLGSAVKAKKNKYSIIEVPTDNISRFVVLPKEKDKNFVILLDDVIRFCLENVFNNFGHDYIEAYNIKLTRDAEIDIDNDLSKSFIEKISKGLKDRKKGQPVRLVYDSEIAPDMLAFIMKKTKLRKADNLIPGGRYHNFKDFMSFPNIGNANLKYPETPVLKHPDLPDSQSKLNRQSSFFEILKQKDVLLTFPYQSFDHIIDLLREASIDPKVQSIQITLYRVAQNSNVVKALINAIKNGKQVTAVIELQARFDEEANIYWASKLQEEGAKVIYGVPGLKVHSKLLLISRRESGKIFNYGYLGTGNFNGDTARVYTDHSLLTTDKRITDEIVKIFIFYLDNLKSGSFKHLLVSPFFMRKRILQLIDVEIKNALNNKPASIFLKLNNLVDTEVINKFYEASTAGVKIKLIVRGMCSLVAGVRGVSDNIEAISIVDKFLEHSRIFMFHNGGNEKYYLTSADWMARNFDQRSEIAVPIYDGAIKQQLKSILDILWADNTKARIIDSKQKNEYRPVINKKKVRAQVEIYNFLKSKK